MAMTKDNRPLDELTEFSTTIAGDINDLATTSPHGSDFGYYTLILGVAFDPNAAPGTATTHRGTRCVIGWRGALTPFAETQCFIYGPEVEVPRRSTAVQKHETVLALHKYPWGRWNVQGQRDRWARPRWLGGRDTG